MREMVKMGLVVRVKGEDGAVQWHHTDKWDKSVTFNNPVDSKMSS